MVPTSANELREKEMEQRMYNAAQGMMNAAGQSSMQGMMNAAGQSSMLGNFGPTTPGPLTALASGSAGIQSSVTKREKRVRLDVAIEQAKNGYVLTIGGAYNENTESHIATTFEDINTIINSELASRMLDKAE